MNASARGTTENPGKEVKLKSNLNRSILRQGWGEIIEMLAYKVRKAGIRSISGRGDHPKLAAIGAS